MITRTLKQIINQVQQETGLQQASTIIGNDDLTTNQMLGFAQLELEELGKANDWTALTFEYNLVVNAPLETTGDTTIDSAVITNIPSTATLAAYNFYTVGGNIPQGARILTVDSATQVTLTMEATATEVGASITFAQDTYPEPSDFDHFINDTWWDRTNRWMLLGPTSPQEDQWHQSGIVAVGPRRFFRQIGPYANNYRIWPPPVEIVSPLQLVFEYQSQNRVKLGPALTTFGDTWTADTDVPLLDARAITMGIKWRFWEQKGLNWTAKRTDYQNYVDQLKARDGGAKRYNLAPSYASITQRRDAKTRFESICRKEHTRLYSIRCRRFVRLRGRQAGLEN
jgi:hypothetical protein